MLHDRPAIRHEAEVAGLPARVWWCAPDALGDLGLTAPERTRLRRLRRDGDRARFATGRRLARAVLGELLGLAPGAVRIGTPADGGRPVLADAPDLSFSLAHSGERVVLAVATARGVLVGADVERIAGAPTSAALLAEIATPAERAALNARPATERHAGAVALWTRKEALLKARGTGLAVPPREADTLAAARSLAALDLGPGYAACVAAISPGSASASPTRQQSASWPPAGSS